MADKDNENTFKILKDYFRQQLVKYLDSISHTKNLIIEPNLIGVVKHLLSSVPESCRVNGFGSLVGYQVCISLLDP
jgi:hypothetical protein